MATLIILCASHLNEDINIHHMNAMLDSQIKQSHVCDIYISLTGLSLEYLHPRVHIFKQPEPYLTQFEHYKRLVSRLCHDNILTDRNYAIFSDDDDIMDRTRNQTYLNELDDVSVKMVCFDNSVVRVALSGDFGDHPETIILATNCNEYVKWCVRGDILHEIIGQMSDERTKVYAADVEFARRLSAYERNTKIIYIDKPLYYYRYNMFVNKRYCISDRLTQT